MSEINALSGFASVYQGASRSAQGQDGLSIDDFYYLLSAQLKYQDADNPMDTSEMMSMMVQTQMIDAITQMATTNTITYATSMMGKTVTMVEIDANGMYTGENTTGTVSGVLLGENPTLYIDGKPYSLSQLMTVGDVPLIDNSESDTSTDTDTDTSTDTSTDTGDTTI